MVSGATIFFWIILIGGGWLLWFINRSSHTPKTSLAKPKVPLPPQDLVEELLANGALSPTGRREWLDRLLVAQQQDEE